MKKLIVSLILFLCFLSARPQRTADLGVRIGASAYWGDIQNVDYSKSITALYGVLGRYNFNKRMSVRGQLVTGNLQAYGTLPGVNLADPNGNPPNNDRGVYLQVLNNDYYFKRRIQTFEALFEFNFLDYQLGSVKKNRFTPFLSIGIGGFYSRAPRQGTIILEPNSVPINNLGFNVPVSVPLYNTFYAYIGPSGEISNKTDALSPIIPMGFGIKYNLTKRLGACVEFCVRKTFTDNIDNLVDPARFQTPIRGFIVGYQPEVASNKLINNDWYASLHLSLHWQVWTQKGNCIVNDPNAKYGKKSAF